MGLRSIRIFEGWEDGFAEYTDLGAAGGFRDHRGGGFRPASPMYSYPIGM